MARTNPLKRSCPVCDSPRDHPCVDDAGAFLPRFHDGRAAPSSETNRRVRDKEFETFGSVGA